ncbi:sigma-E processing peptidase SpoIIGA [Clostridium sp. DL1XJH146]
MVIFADIVFIENLIINYFLLVMTTKVMELRYKIKNAILSASVGSFIAVIGLYDKFNFIYSFIFKLITALLMIILLFYRKKYILYFKGLVTFIFISFIMSGICISLNYLNYSSIHTTIESYSYKKLILALIIFYLFVNRFFVFIRDRKSLKVLIFQTNIYYKNTMKTVTAFMDTGNELREPSTNLPVIIVEKNVFKEININNPNTYLIPYKGINGEISKFEGFLPDYVEIIDDCGITGIKRQKAIIALCDRKLSAFNDYNALLSRGIF